MGKIKTKLSKIMDWFMVNRNKLYMEVCLLIHIAYMVLFFKLDILVLAYLNLCSSAFYIYFRFIKKDTSEKSMMYTYCEILLFAGLSELALGRDYGFFLYIVGLSATVFYLVPSYGNKRFVYQIISIATVLLLEGIIMVTGIHFPSIQDAAASYQPAIYLANIGITATIVLAATFFYSKETESVWETLRYNMNHDVLTGLYNRRFLERHIELIPEKEKSQYVIAMVDIDFFKKVNDTYGHEAGDEVLVRVSDCLKDTAGKNNLAVRWGGEEFILYFPNSTTEQIHPVIEALRKRIEDMVIEVRGKDIRVTITSGIATGLADSNYEKVINNADEKLYLGKQRGRNRVVI